MPISSSNSYLSQDTFLLCLKTIGYEREKTIRFDFILGGVGGSEHRRCFIMECRTLDLWRYYISRYGSPLESSSWPYLEKVPSDQVKHWTITKTSVYLTVVCNGVTVLNFNFLTKIMNSKADERQFWFNWSKSCVSIKFEATFEKSLLLEKRR